MAQKLQIHSVLKMPEYSKLQEYMMKDGVIH